MSTLFDKPDEESLQLRAEFKQLVKDVLSHKVLYTPCPQRDIDDSINRIEAVNKMTIQEYQSIKSQNI